MNIENGTKVTASHQNRKAFVYVRQSSMRQLVENTEALLLAVAQTTSNGNHDSSARSSATSP